MNYNFEKPFIWLARKLSGDNNLHFVEAPALKPPEATLDMADIERFQKDMADAAAMPLPDDDEDL